jgi:hypothetical protein
LEKCASDEPNFANNVIVKIAAQLAPIQEQVAPIHYRCDRPIGGCPGGIVSLGAETSEKATNGRIRGILSTAAANYTEQKAGVIWLAATNALRLLLKNSRRKHCSF